MNPGQEQQPCYIKMRDVELYYPSTIYNSTTLKEQIFAKLSRKPAKKNKLYDVHAIRNFSIDVREGERVGVIGRNGAGKSTLLKAMAGLYPIRSGSVEVQGSIRAMLELTLGFDMMSTGRDNIMYRGLMLGRTPDEIREYEQEIIEFSELGEFIDYPVTSYSSGMLVRLAFSILTTFSGEVLLIDEVLSAGDAGFQAKARQRMIDTMDRAKILVLVLHDMSSIQQICNRVVMLEKGKIVMDGAPEDIVQHYLESL